MKIYAIAASARKKGICIATRKKCKFHIETYPVKALAKFLRGMSGKHIKIITNYSLLYNGINDWVANWARRGWRKSGKGDISHLDSWKVIWDIMQNNKIKCIKVYNSDNSKYQNMVQLIKTELIERINNE